jgi:phage baseplate assembly protein gpV
MEMQVTGWPSLVPGTKIALDGAGEPFDGTYTITTTRHVFDAHNVYSTWIGVTGRQVRTLYGLAASGEAQPKPRVPGVVNAIVTDINDPNKQGRVKLRFPWFSDTYVSDWVRTVQFGGYRGSGLGGGGVIGPEVEDEVLVAFDRGSMDLPYVIGGLYSPEHDQPLDLGEDDVPLTSGGAVTRRTIASRTGQRIDLLDSTAKQKTGVRLSSGDDKYTVFLNQNQKSITISSQAAGGKIEVTGQGDGSKITISSLGSGSSTLIESTGPVSVRSSQSVSIEAPTISITGATSVKGDLSVTGTLTQTGPIANFSGFVSVEGGANIAGDVTIEGAENVVGIITQDGAPVL